MFLSFDFLSAAGRSSSSRLEDRLRFRFEDGISLSNLSIYPDAIMVMMKLRSPESSDGDGLHEKKDEGGGKMDFFGW